MLLPLDCKPTWLCIFGSVGGFLMLSLHRLLKTKNASRWLADGKDWLLGASLLPPWSSTLSFSSPSSMLVAIIRIKTEVTNCCNEARAVVLLESVAVVKYTWYNTRIVCSKCVPLSMASPSTVVIRQPVDNKNFIAASSLRSIDKSDEKTDWANISTAM